MPIRPLAVSLAATLALVGCGSRSPDETTLDRVDLDVGATVTADDLAFSPDHVTVEPGQLVELENDDSTDHTFTADDLEEHPGFDSGTMQPGDDFTVAFDDPGTVPFHCEIHPRMRGRITVETVDGEEP